MENAEFQELMLQHLGKVLGKLESMDNRLSGVENELVQVKNELVQVKNELGQVKESQVRMENELGEKITALFDGYSLRGDQIAGLKGHFDNRLDSLSEDVNYLVKKSFRHEEAILELRKIR